MLLEDDSNAPGGHPRCSRRTVEHLKSGSVCKQAWIWVNGPVFDLGVKI